MGSKQNRNKQQCWFLNRNENLCKKKALPGEFYCKQHLPQEGPANERYIQRGRYTFLTFREARRFARSLKLKTVEEWQQYCVGNLKGYLFKPPYIPSAPNWVYRNQGWVCWGDWLGNGQPPKKQVPRGENFLPFEEAREFAQSLGLDSEKEWALFCHGKLGMKRPLNIPVSPHEYYKHDGWISWGDWLGTGRIASQLMEFWPFEKAREFAQSLKLKSQTEWVLYVKGELNRKAKEKPEGVPSNPQSTYRNKGWIGWGDWIGTRRPTWKDKMEGNHILPFEEARAFVHKLKLKSKKEWLLYHKGELPGYDPKPDNIPTAPWRAYKNNGWRSMGDWLGTGTISPQLMEYRSFEEARQFARQLGLKTASEWIRYAKGKMDKKVKKKPADIPAAPQNVYCNKGWISWGDWLATGTVASQLREFLPFEEARQYVHKLVLKSSSEWSSYCKGEMSGIGKKPDNIPADPTKVYRKKGWVSWGDWLGTGTVAPNRRKYLPFKKARQFVRKLGLKNSAEWRKYSKDGIPGKGKRPDNIPSAPYTVYRNKGWKDIKDWLGVEK